MKIGDEVILRRMRIIALDNGLVGVTFGNYCVVDNWVKNDNIEKCIPAPEPWKAGDRVKLSASDVMTYEIIHIHDKKAWLREISKRRSNFIFDIDAGLLLELERA